MEKGARRDGARKEGWMGGKEGFDLLEEEWEEEEDVKDLEEAEVG